MDGRGRELVAADEPTVVSEPFLDMTVVEDGQSDGCLSDPSRADESDWSEIFREADNLLDQPIAPETGPRWRRR